MSDLKYVGQTAAAKLVSLVKIALNNKADKTNATTSAAGLMSAADKAKLDGIEEGATMVIVDDAMSGTSTNPVQNKVVKAALDKKASTDIATPTAPGLMSAIDKSKLNGIEIGANKTVVDATLDATSTNPVQNKVIKEALDKKAGKDVATADADGLMSAEDKVKLDGIEDGATKTIVDDVMSDTSTNPVQNKVVKKYIDSHGVPQVTTQNDTMLIQVVDGAYALRTKESIFPVDDALDTESKNAVENGVIARTIEVIQGHTQLANGTRDGLMSASDYTKLSNIESGATKTIVDAALDASSTNPVQNKAVKTALDGKAGTAEATTGAAGLMSAADKTKLDGVESGANKTTVDAALDAASENPVQNKAVKAALDGKLSTLGGEISGHLEVGQTVSAEGSVSVGRTSADTGIHFEKAASDAGRISHGSDPMTGVSPIARLKVATPTEDDDAVTKKYVDDRAVRHDAAQGLTSDQKLIACSNIGAVNEKRAWVEGEVVLLPRGADGAYTINITPSENSNDYTLALDAGPENVPVYVAGIETPTDAQTDCAANVAYVKAKIAEVSASGGVTVDTAMSDTSTNPVQNKTIKKYVDDHAVSLPLVLTYTYNQVTGAPYSEIRKAIESGRQIKLAVANTTDIIAYNAKNETNKSVLRFNNIDVGGDTVNIAQYNVTAQESGLTVNVKSYEIAQ